MIHLNRVLHLLTDLNFTYGSQLFLMPITGKLKLGNQTVKPKTIN